MLKKDLAQVANIWHCLKLGIVCLANFGPEQVPPICHCLASPAWTIWLGGAGILSPFTLPLSTQSSPAHVPPAICSVHSASESWELRAVPSTTSKCVMQYITRIHTYYTGHLLKVSPRVVLPPPPGSPRPHY